MVFHATVVTVLLAAPGNTADAKAAVLDEVARWNGRYAEGRGFVLSPWTWELHSTPILGDRPQAIINSQGVDKSDAVVAVFGTTLGQPTGVDISGTVEEINRAVSNGKPVHVFFYKGNVPAAEIDAAELQRLRDFRDDLAGRGLYAEYASPRDLASQVREALEFDLDAMEAAPLPVAPAGARLTVQHLHQKEQSGVDNRGKPKYRNIIRALEIANHGDRTAETVRFRVDAFNPEEPIHLSEDTDDEGRVGPFDLTPGSKRTFTCFPVRGATDVQIALTWLEDGVGHDAWIATTIT